MTTETLRDRYGSVIGRIDIESNGDKVIRDKYGRILGRYNKHNNTTHDHYGRLVARGDCLTMLLGNR